MQRIIRVCFLIAFTAAATDTYGQKIVSWSPVALSPQVLRGTTKLINVSLKVSQDLNDVGLFVVPELQTFLSVTPSHFAAIGKNTTVNVSLLFSIPESTVSGLYEGVLMLRDPSRTFPLALSITLLVQEPTSTVIPDGVALPSADRFVIDRGVNFVRDELVVFAQPSASEDEIISLATRLGAAFLGREKRVHFYQLLLPIENLDAALAFMTQLESDPIVRFAVPHFSSSNTAPNIPDDPSWDLFAILTTCLTAPRLCESWAQELIRLPDAWSVTTGGTSVKIGIVDEGFDSNHEDLKDVLNVSLSDLDLNELNLRGHGTAVASIAAAKGNNGKGLAGAMWSSDLLVFSCLSDELECVTMTLNAIDKGARVINFSKGRNDFNPICSPLLSDSDREVAFLTDVAIWRTVIGYASRVPLGVLFVFAAGNDATPFNWEIPAVLSSEDSEPLYRTCGVISVGAVDRNRNQASYSNYGSLSVWAPGGDAPVGMCPNVTRVSNFNTFSFDLLDLPPFSTIWKAQPDNSYGYDGLVGTVGTSIAAPFVTGIAGLMLSVNPNLTAAQLKTIIHNSVDATGNTDLEGNPVLILNAFRAVEQAQLPTVTFLSFLQGDPGIPGDGIFINAGIGSFFELSRPFPLSGVSDGLTVTAFFPSSVQVQVVQLNVESLPDPQNICGSGVLTAPAGTVSFNGVTGFFVNFSQSILLERNPEFSVSTFIFCCKRTSKSAELPNERARHATVSKGI